MGRILILLFGLAVAVASPASACRIAQPSAMGLSQYETVVLASVSEAEQIENSPFYTWRITAQAIQNVSGEAGANTYQFTAALYSNGCGFWSPVTLRPPGELWVLYLTAPEASSVSRAFPLEMVRDHDPRLADLP